MAKVTHDGILLDRLGIYGVSSLLGHRLAFINISLESLNNPVIDRLQPQNTVLMLNATECTGESEEALARVTELKGIGYSFGVRIINAADSVLPLMSQADYVQIGVTAFDGLDLRTLTRNLKNSRPERKMPPQLIADDVQSHDDFQFCVRCGFDLLQGPFISSRQSLRPTSDGVNRMVLLPILGMVRKDLSFALIAEQLKNEPTMTYKLLRYFNSAAAGMQHRIGTLTEALIILGREKFYRWTSLLLFDFKNPGYQERVLAEQALARGYTLELIAGKGHIPNDPANLFLMGLFSLLDQALGRPLAELIEKAALPDVVRDALVQRTGTYADALALIILGESNATASPEEIIKALSRCGIGYADYACASAKALDWACRMLGDAEESAAADALASQS